MALRPPPPKNLTLSFRFSSQLQREFRDTLKGSQMGLRLFLTNCEAQGQGLRRQPLGGGQKGVLVHKGLKVS